MIRPYRIKELQKAFRLNPFKLHKSTGLTVRECIWHFRGNELEPIVAFTLQNFYSDLEDKVSKINRSLNLVKGVI